MTIRSVAPKLGNWLVAGAIGAGTSLLFAPHSGRTTRRLIRRRARKYIRDARDEVAEQAEGLYIRGKQATEDAARRMRRKLNLAA